MFDFFLFSHPHTFSSSLHLFPTYITVWAGFVHCWARCCPLFLYLSCFEISQSSFPFYLLHLCPILCPPLCIGMVSLSRLNPHTALQCCNDLFPFPSRSVCYKIVVFRSSFLRYRAPGCVTDRELIFLPDGSIFLFPFPPSLPSPWLWVLVHLSSDTL